MRLCQVRILCYAVIVNLAFQSGCGSKKPMTDKQNTYERTDVTGTWSNLSMTVTYQDRDSVFDVPEGKWQEILKIKPILTTYSDDGSFESKYYGLNDSLLFTSSGSWSFSDDSLFLTSNGSTTSYKFEMNQGVGEFTGILDWNEDGVATEIYSGRQRKH